MSGEMPYPRGSEEQVRRVLSTVFWNVVSKFTDQMPATDTCVINGDNLEMVYE